MDCNPNPEMIPELGVVDYQQPQEAISLIMLLLCQGHSGLSPSQDGWGEACGSSLEGATGLTRSCNPGRSEGHPELSQ